MPNRVRCEEMIIDKQKRFIFIHSPRTGGSSIRHTLKPFDNELIYEEIKYLNRNYSTTLSKHVTSFLNPNYTLYTHLTHINLNILSDFLTDIKEYKYKFCCVRNPFARTFSYYNKLSGGVIPPRDPSFTFERFVELIYDSYCNSPNALWRRYPAVLPALPYKFWTAGADEVIKFEDLYINKNNKWHQLMQSCGVPPDGLQPHKNRSPGFNNNLDPITGYREHYSKTSIEKIKKVFGEEIETYEYEF